MQKYLVSRSTVRSGSSRGRRPNGKRDKIDVDRKLARRNATTIAGESKRFCFRWTFPIAASVPVVMSSPSLAGSKPRSCRCMLWEWESTISLSNCYAEAGATERVPGE
jgi:hypothetical protein